jgi:hypothetical protein
METEKRFNVGDEVTYLSFKDCPSKRYAHGGTDRGGGKGEVYKYSRYNADHDCWAIVVSLPDSNELHYHMLESEFEEYLNQVNPEVLSNYLIY